MSGVCTVSKNEASLTTVLTLVSTLTALAVLPVAVNLWVVLIPVNTNSWPSASVPSFLVLWVESGTLNLPFNLQTNTSVPSVFSVIYPIA